MTVCDGEQGTEKKQERSSQSPAAQSWNRTYRKGRDVLGTRPNSSVGASTFVGLRAVKPKRILSLGKFCLEDVASGYWTILAK